MNTTSTPTPTPTPLSRNFTPSRFSERAFRNYEPFITRAVSSWPAETQFHPSDMVDLTGRAISPHTFVARFRDAITALKRFGYETTLDTEKLWSITGFFTVSYGSEGTVWFRNKQLRGRPTSLTAEARARGYDIPKRIEQVSADIPSSPSGAEVKTMWSSYTPDDLRALCQLITTGFITGPVILEGTLSPDAVASFESAYNVTITPDTTRNTLIVL